ncbi:MAG: DMT family transporter [Proteobacteria bacterium]|nr:DMT family transporter [Pseudomonadota bacterium]
MNPVIGATLWMGGALLSFMCMAIAVRELSAALSTFQILFWRSLIGFVIITCLISFFGWRHARTRRLPAHFARSIVHFGGQYGWILGIAALPLAEVFSIEFTTPVWTMILAALFLGEVITRVRVFALVLGFTGILVILRPGFETIEVAQLAVLGSALGFAASYVFTKTLVESDTPLAILFYMSLMQMPMALVGGVTDWAWPVAEHWVWVIVTGVGGLTAHYSLAKALQLAEATIVTTMDFMRLPLIAAVGFLIYGERFDTWVFAGACIIFAGIFLNVRTESKRVRTAGGAPNYT